MLKIVQQRKNKEKHRNAFLDDCPFHSGPNNMCSFLELAHWTRIVAKDKYILSHSQISS